MSGTCLAGTLIGTTYTTGNITGDCTVIATFTLIPVKVDGGWTDWSAKNNACGHSGTQTRTCTNPTPSNEGAVCVGDSSRTYTNESCSTPTATISATKIVCTNEADLPNWGTGGPNIPNITLMTASNWVASHQSCSLKPDWQFQWAPSGTSNPGNNITSPAESPWTTSSLTSSNGTVSINIPLSASTGADAPVNLLSAGNFTILSKTSITTTGVTSITGDIGISPNGASSMTGFGQTLDSSGTFSTSALVNGQIYASNYSPTTPTTMTTAISAMETAYTDANSRATDVLNAGAGNLAGLDLVPGVYTFDGVGNVLITSDVTLTGGPNDVWIFQIPGTLDISAGKKILLSGGAQASNIFWAVAGTTTLEPNSIFEGNILGGPGASTIAMQNGAELHGRALGQTNVTLIGNIILFPSVSLGDNPSVWFREVLQNGYIPFTYDGENNNNVSAELYCNTDVLNYDNYDRVDNLVAGENYYCIGFNVLKAAPITSYTVTATGTGSGTITPPTQSATSGTTVAFTVTPNSGYQVTMGGTCPAGTLVDNTYTTGIITASCNVTATFAAIPANSFTLTITTPGTGTGIITGAGVYTSGTVVTATATPNTDSTFDGWSTNCPGGVVTVTGDTTCTATFTLKTVATDVCSNIEGIQTSAPSGMQVDSNKNCTAIPVVHHSSSGSRPVTTTVGKVLGESTTCGIYVDKFVKMGLKGNDTAAVKKIQIFLNDYMSSGLKVDGIVGVKTDAAIRAFQVKRFEKVLAPWGLGASTGIFYLTTQTEVNNIMCPALNLPIPTLIPTAQNASFPKY